jgi:hypothetical protein
VEQADLTQLVNDIKSSDGKTRLKAQQSAGPVGAQALPALADLAASSDKGVAKAARGAMETVAHYAARPGAGAEAKAVSAELLKIAQTNRPRQVRADAIYLLGFTANDGKTVEYIAELLLNRDLWDEARMALERIPGNAATNALKKAAKTANDEMRPHLEQSLKNRATTMKTVGIAAK